VTSRRQPDVRRAHYSDTISTQMAAAMPFSVHCWIADITFIITHDIIMHYYAIAISLTHIGLHQLYFFLLFSA